MTLKLVCMEIKNVTFSIFACKVLLFCHFYEPLARGSLSLSVPNSNNNDLLMFSVATDLVS